MAAILAAGLLMIVGCSQPEAEGPPVYKVQLDWFPEPEHGGLFQAKAQGYFEQAGFTVDPVPFSGNVDVVQFVGAGKMPFGQAATSAVIQGVANEVPVKILASVFPNAPTVLMLHESNPIDTFEELDGQTIMARPGATFIPYLQQKFDIAFDVIASDFSLSRFLNDPEFIQEGFYIAEFYFIREQGVTPKALRIWEAGFRNSLTMIVNADFAEKNPEVVAAFREAYIRGWTEYLTTGDPTPAQNALKAASEAIGKDLSDDFLDFSRDIIIEDNLALGDAPYSEPIGVLSVERIKEQITQLENHGVIEKGAVDADSLFWRPGS